MHFTCREAAAIREASYSYVHSNTEVVVARRGGTSVGRSLTVGKADSAAWKA